MKDRIEQEDEFKFLLNQLSAKSKDLQIGSNQDRFFF